MLLIPNHRHSTKAGRSITLVPAEYNGVVVTSRFLVARTQIRGIYRYHIRNLDIVKQRLLTLVSSSSSTFERLMAANRDLERRRAEVGQVEEVQAMYMAGLLSRGLVGLMSGG